MDPNGRQSVESPRYALQQAYYLAQNDRDREIARNVLNDYDARMRETRADAAAAFDWTRETVGSGFKVGMTMLVAQAETNMREENGPATVALRAGLDATWEIAKNDPQALVFEGIRKRGEEADTAERAGDEFTARKLRTMQNLDIGSGVIGVVGMVRYGLRNLSRVISSNMSKVAVEGASGATALRLEQRMALNPENDFGPLNAPPASSPVPSTHETGFIGPVKPSNWDALTSHPDGHAFSVHGGSVTDAQLIARARTGIKPNGSTGPVPPLSSAFYSDELLILADQKIRSSGGLQKAIARQPGQSVVRVEVQDVGDTGLDLGYGYKRIGQTGNKNLNESLYGPLQRVDNLRGAQGIYEINPSNGQWETITVYPTQHQIQ